ncbi:MAG: hypothetical protein RR202_05405 [Bacteroidales bacterium]
MAMMMKEKCVCGDPNPKFKLAGRAGEDFKLGGAYVSIDVFEKVVNEHSSPCFLYAMYHIIYK